MAKRQKTIRISCLGTPSDYSTSLVPLMIHSLGYKIQWVRPVWADLVIYGSFYDIHASSLRWLPRVWRKKAGQWIDVVEKELSKRKLPPVTLFHTAENLRHDHIKADYSISHDLDVQSDRHFRLPYWMEVIDWSHEGIVGNSNPRYGELLKLEKLQTPLGDQFLKRPQKAAFITSNLNGTKANCYKFLKNYLQVDGMGPYFDSTIRDHHRSWFLKKDILQKYAFNLCPENSIYAGYVTEKIPEAFAIGCLPITCVDESLSVEFNPKAIVNLEIMMREGCGSLVEIFGSKEELACFADQRLLLQRPSVNKFRHFIESLAADVKS